MEWSIQSRAHECQACGRGFRDKEPLHTLLFDERQAYIRLDVCEACWQAQYSQGANHRRGFVSHWVGVYSPPPPAPAEPIRKETAETLLRKLLERNDPRHVPACFILAVMLERKRILKVKAQSQETGRRVFVYEHPKSGDLFTVPDPGLRLDQLEAVQHDVAHLLEHGLDPVEPPPAQVASAEADPGSCPSEEPRPAESGASGDLPAEPSVEAAVEGGLNEAGGPAGAEDSSPPVAMPEGGASGTVKAGD
ncbi:MAG TPA: hypothetical protein PKM73_00010 [Verrucomicrobiota bacterium]|nr:hypothetical protein [Verrucomicrobiota bacterium]HNU49426.1 hypothetical protein [Verrucomicrobiota bacterium]